MFKSKTISESKKCIIKQQIKGQNATVDALSTYNIDNISLSSLNDDISNNINIYQNNNIDMKPDWLNENGTGKFSGIEKNHYLNLLNNFGKPNKDNPNLKIFEKIFYYRQVSSLKGHINHYEFDTNNMKWIIKKSK